MHSTQNSLGFTIRRVTSGLSPQQVRSEIGERFRRDASSDFEDARIETPITIRESTQSWKDSRSAAESSSPKTNGGEPHGAAERYQSFLLRERETIRNEHLIGKSTESLSNQYGAGNTSSSLLTHKQPNEQEIEFDSSDREEVSSLPSKSHKEDMTSSASTNLLTNNDTDNYKTNLTRTPRKSSPLRKEVRVNSSSVKSAAEEIAGQIARSGATKSKSTQEIIDQINSSVERLRERDMATLVGADTDEESEDDGEILRSLDDFLPKVPSNILPENDSPDENSPSLKINQSLRHSPTHTNVSVQRNIPILNPSPLIQPASEKKYTPLPSSPTRNPTSFKDTAVSLKNEYSSARSTKRRPETTSRKLSGKFARNMLRKRHSYKQNRYQNWSKRKWDKLKGLLASSIPKDVIINSSLVMEDLGCNRSELIERICFLEQGKLPS
ncbi:hypothetical protein A9F13_06g01793 [Clavispora lusitaniae]|uniref:Uncharacterized protein n=1 Tax=Clavispora lusitaniae TaxID=36911 RepID=A0AA91Q1K6_CLALS|nr:hypothetical protein A9F13_06g01793 [Clavispora lusitaniae]